MSIQSDNQSLVADLQQWLNRKFSAGLKVDGHGGALTRSVLNTALPDFRPQQVVVNVSGDLDPRSARNIATLLPQVHPLAQQLIAEAAKKGIQIKVISGHRSYAEQDALYKQAMDGKDNDQDGRVDESDERVTKARGGYSNHNFGLAFDIGIFEGAKYLGDSPLYATVGRLGRVLGLEWGGDWTSFKDYPHFQFRPHWAKGLSESEMLTGLRRRVANKQSLV